MDQKTIAKEPTTTNTTQRFTTLQYNHHNYSIVYLHYVTQISFLDSMYYFLIAYLVNVQRMVISDEVQKMAILNFTCSLNNAT